MIVLFQTFSLVKETRGDGDSGTGDSGSEEESEEEDDEDDDDDIYSGFNQYLLLILLLIIYFLLGKRLISRHNRAVSSAIKKII